MSNYSIQYLLLNIPLLMVALGTMHIRQLYLITPAVLIPVPGPQSHRYQLHIHSHHHKLVSQMAAHVNHIHHKRLGPSMQSLN